MSGLRSHDVVSLIRPLLGLFVLSELMDGNGSWNVLPATLVAIATDYLDGEMARSSGDASVGGRFLDNICDVVFLALAFAGFAVSAVWSEPAWGSAIDYSEHANWLPFGALLIASTVYFLRSVAEYRAGIEPRRSPRGHSAGVGNYALVVVGALAVIPPIREHSLYPLSRWLLEPAFVTVALLNLTSVTENLLLLVSTRRARP